MPALLLLVLHLVLGLARAGPVLDNVSLQVKAQIVSVNGTVEYSSQCKTCPYNLCTNVNIPYATDKVTLTCWANGSTVGDSTLWLKTTSNCYIPEYDLVQYSGDFSKDLKPCGNIPQKITKQAARLKYLSTCNWKRYTEGQVIAYYGRDKDITLTCWGQGTDGVLNNPYWYKTTDNCHVNGAVLWKAPDHSTLDPCGPQPDRLVNETTRSTDDDETVIPELLNDEVAEEEATSNEGKENNLARRWLIAEQIGEEYSYCRSCAGSVTSPSCKLIKTYEYNQTIVSQCYKRGTITRPDGTSDTTRWMYTTDWCWVNGTDFWNPPWDHWNYPECRYWGIS